MKTALGILKRHLIVFRRTLWSNTVFNALEPFLYLSAMGYGLGAYVQDIGGMSYIQFLAPGMVASAAMWAATFECTYSSFVRLHFQKTFHAMLAGPATVTDVVAGEVLFGIVKNVVFGIVILLVIAAMGQVQSVWSLLIPVFLIFPGAVFSLMALSYTGIIGHIDYLNYYITLVTTPMYLFAGVFFPIVSMPAWMQTLVWLNPLYHSVEVCRALVVGNVSMILWQHIASLALFAIVLGKVPGYFLKKRLIS
ncbi:MAG: type transporter [Pelosinus sp.]|jgi:lipooligosaccharide transport system permease protein|nr:type transporter [Pelosinus sp.]